MPADTAPAPVPRYLHPKGNTFEEMRQNVLGTDLWKRGDTVLVWVNEGDLIHLGGLRSRAAAAAAWVAAREAGAVSLLAEANGWAATGANTEASAIRHASSLLRALPPPADAMAALAEVVRVAKEEEREACEQAARSQLDPGFPDDIAEYKAIRGHYNAGVLAVVQAIRARGEGGE